MSLPRLSLTTILRCAALLFLSAAGIASAQTNIRPSAASQAGSTNSNVRRTTNSTTNNNSLSSTGARQYRSNTVLGDALIQVDPETRSLVVVTDDDTHKEIEKVLRKLDRPKPQVLIKVLFVEVTHDKNFDLGVEGNYTFKVGNPFLSGSVSTPPTTSLQSLFGLAQQTNGSFVRVVTDDYSATLRALASHGNVNVLSRPSIMARNNQEAVIVVGEEVPFVTNSQITNTGQTINTIQYNDVGIILRVTPFINQDKSVEMIVAPEISSLSDKTVDISPTVKSPVIEKRSAETVVVTPNATTVVIGGLMETQRTQSVDKIPILGDIPVIGFPFRHVVKSTAKKELMIFLTPYIVESKQSYKDLTLDEANRADLIPDAFSPHEVKQNFDTLTLMPEVDEKEALPVRNLPPPPSAPDPTPVKKKPDFRVR
jgi:general secretion pathway protein D